MARRRHHLLILGTWGLCACLGYTPSDPPDAAAPTEGGFADDVHLTPDTDNCAPAGITKHACPWTMSGSNTCPPGKLCQAFKTCVVPGCSDAPLCTIEPDIKKQCFFAWPLGSQWVQAKETMFNATATYSTSAGNTSLELGDTKAGFRVTWTLPQGMKVPVSEGDEVKVEACPVDPQINTRWVLAIYDAAGKLLVVGGQGIDASRSPCLQRAVKTARQALGCRPYKTAADPLTMLHTEAFALGFTSDTNPVSVGMGQRKSFTSKGRKLEATVCDARHPMEWQVTDIYGSFEGFVVVAS